MGDIVWGWKAIQSEIGRLMGYEPEIRTLRRWAENGVIDMPLPVRTSKFGRVFVKMSELVTWCHAMTE